MKKEKKYKRIHKSAKVLGAVLLGALAITGGVFAMPVNNNGLNKGEVMTVVKTMVQNDINYIDQWNKEFSEGYKEFDKNVYLESFEKYTGEEAENEGAVLDALENKDYETWKKATQNLEGYPTGIEPLPEEEFEILADLKK